ncbi:hypothetical protein [Escherichia coli]|uniref:hypothetical protein n=1 Tax=Escherichia coli TaxID=562 RepID=UPI00388E62A5
MQSDEEKALLRRQAAQKTGRKAAQQQKDHESSAKRVESSSPKLNEPQQQTAYWKKGLQVHKGVFTDKEGQKTFILLDVGGKQWTMQYINEDGTKRFAKNARKEGCFHVVGGLDALKESPVLIVAEGYAAAEHHRGY